MALPNLLFVLADQQRYHTLGVTGNATVRTPYIDTLAAQGMTVDQCISGHSLCAPYRATLLTGNYAWRHGVIDNEYALRPDQVTLPQVLGQHGYRTAWVGKWHLGYGPYCDGNRHGFDYLAGYDSGFGFFDVEYHENEGGPYRFADWAPIGETDLAIRFMREHRAKHPDRPFALVVSWGPPHWPYEQYPSRFRRLSAGDVRVPGNVPQQMRAFAAEEAAHYHNCIEALDSQFGRLVTALEELGLFEKTIVVFTSDHGDHLSSHGYGKPRDWWMHPSMRASCATPYEESIHVPFVIRYPAAVPAGARTNDLVCSLDIMPSILGLIGIKPPVTDGLDLSHLLRGKDGPRRAVAYLMNMGPGWPFRGEATGFWRGVRTDRWVYAEWLADKRAPMLFDRSVDPLELDNLAGDAEHTPVQRTLERLLESTMLEGGDPFRTGERDPETGILRLDVRFSDARWDLSRWSQRGQRW